MFEFKVVELVPEGKALQQIRERGYAEKYHTPIHLIGVEFSRKSRSVVGFEVEPTDHFAQVDVGEIQG
ncbi:PD-(D/E)XK nuclease domain-containing protein [Azotobacter chroococcum]|uniref:PD-(D/E)XK nuclease domain-containing protein n=1 Tax=Azotobacter chroococcum TaxID=353 RepID=UPI001F6090D2|nr:PD-(D/E)XK nuclease domain-containing protein [Azotobacter chroococcum]